MKPKPSAPIAILLLLIISCNKNDVPPPPDPCQGIIFTINTTKTEAGGGAGNGTITVLEPRGDTISYKLNNGTYQSSWYFNNLAAGSYVITIRNQKGCTDTTQVTILDYGPKYAQVKQIILGYCGPCHLNGTVNGGMNFDTDARIVAAKDRIKVRTVDGIPSFMPEGSQLTSVDKQKILDWVNAGGTISN